MCSPAFKRAIKDLTDDQLVEELREMRFAAAEEMRDEQRETDPQRRQMFRTRYLNAMNSCSLIMDEQAIRRKRKGG